MSRDADVSSSSSSSSLTPATSAAAAAAATSLARSASSGKRMIEVDEDWEEWDPSKGSFRVHAAAGSFAGLCEHCFVYPIDTVKTHLQTEGASKESFVASVKKGGVRRLWRGVSTMFTGCVPAHALYFTIYEKGKQFTGLHHDEHQPLKAGAIGATATIAHDLIMNPMDVIKQRLQLGFHSGMFDCARSIVRAEGFGALYVSLPTTLVMNMPYAAIMVGTNESMKTLLNPENKADVTSFLISGAVAGAVAASATNPFDVVKTRLQTQTICCGGGACAREQISTVLKPRSRDMFGTRSKKLKFESIIESSMKTNRGLVAAPTAPGTVRGVWDSAYKCRRLLTRRLEQTTGGGGGEGGGVRYRGMRDTAATILREEGPAGFARGLKPRLFVHAPACAISWTSYEMCKRFLTSD